MNVLVIAEHQNQQLKRSTFSAITAASQIAPKVTVLIAGYQCADVVKQAQTIEQVNTIIVADNAVYQHKLPERLAPLIMEHAQSYSHFLAAATTFGKNIMPRLAALLDVGQISDITRIIDSSTFSRPIYAGNAIATVKSLDSQHVVTIRTTAFEPAQQGGATAKIIESNYVSNNTQSQFLDEKVHVSDRPELSSADIVISGGRGLKNNENFSRLRCIADQMQAAMGASRAAVDADLAPNDCQIGQTGQVVAPKLYIAVGISGAIQHVAGMKDSKTIMAINKDANAPIFQIADYGLIADIDEILPQWEEKLKNENWNT
jgi:electron transfer flavoprotein alpha subunit